MKSLFLVFAIVCLCACDQHPPALDAKPLTGLEPIDDVGYTQLHEAAKENDVPAIERFLKTFPEVDIDTRGNLVGTTALERAVAFGNLEATVCLLDHGANIEGYNIRGPLMRAASQGHLEIARLLVQRGASVNQQDKARK